MPVIDYYPLSESDGRGFVEGLGKTSGRRGRENRKLEKRRAKSERNRVSSYTKFS